jgi:hypothetical protein
MIGTAVCRQLSSLVSESLFEAVWLMMKSKDEQVKAKAVLLLKESSECLL